MDITVQLLLDERDITKVCHRYATALDTKDWPLLRSCFLPDAVAVYEGIGECPGYDAIEALCQSALGPLTRTQHLVGNVDVVVRGTPRRRSATCRRSTSERGSRAGTCSSSRGATPTSWSARTTAGGSHGGPSRPGGPTATPRWSGAEPPPRLDGHRHRRGHLTY